MELEKYNCPECNEEITDGEELCKTRPCSRDMGGIVIEPDEDYYFCPHCHNELPEY